MKLILVFVVFTFLIGFLLAQKEEFDCMDGVNYVENDCNRCTCGKGILACTQRACFGDHHERLEKCIVGTTFKRSCNECWCAKGFGTVCTNKKC